MSNYIHTFLTAKKQRVILLFTIVIIANYLFYKNGVIPYQHSQNLNDLLNPLIFIIIGTMTSYITNLIFDLIFKEKNYLTLKGIFSGLLIGLLAPSYTPITFLIFGILMSIIISRLLSILWDINLNPLLLGLLIIVLMTHSITLSNIPIYSKETLINAIEGNIPNTINIIIYISIIILLLSTKAIKWKISIGYILSIFLITSILKLDLGYGLFNILIDNSLIYIFLVAPYSKYSPINDKYTFLYGICLGIITILIRFNTSITTSSLVALCIMNLLLPLIDRLTYKPI